MRKYNTKYRKSILHLFDQLEKNEYYQIYKIIENDIGNTFSNNKNGIFININRLSDECIDNMVEYINILNESSQQNKIVNSQLFKNEMDTLDVLAELGHKLSSKERCIIKKLQYSN